MKVALVSFDFGEYSIRLASSLAQAADVLLLLPRAAGEPYAGKLSAGVRWQPFDKPRLRQPIRQLGMVRDLWQAIERFRPDVIHMQHCHLWFNLALPFLRRYPLVITIHDPTHHSGDRLSQKTPQAAMDYAYRRADRLIVHGEGLADEVVERLQVGRDRVHVVPMIALGDIGATRQVAEEGNLILFFGRIWPYKGLDYLIRAEPLITAQVAEARIVIAGEGEDFERYRRMMLHPDHFIIHNAYVSDELRAELFQRASIVALPYVDASQSGVVPVAYTFGKPVVATTVGGLPEIVEHGRTGYLVPPRDERALADVLVWLLRNPDLRQRMGANGKRMLETKLAPEVVGRQTLEVYRLAVEDAAMRRAGIQAGRAPRGDALG